MTTNRRTALFFSATFIWTWACYAPLVATGQSPYAMPGMIFLIAGGMGPSLVGVLLVLFTYEPAARRDFWRRCFAPGLIGGRWWLVMALIFPLIYLLAVALDLALGGPLPGLEQLRGLLAQPGAWPLAILLSFLSGPWSEEFGWRGVALDPLLARGGLVGGSALLGGLWGVWHLPLYLMPATWHGQMGFQLAGFWSFLLLNVGLALLMSWVYVHTQRSILTGFLLHLTANFTSQLAAPVSNRVEVLRAVFICGVGLAACLLTERRAARRQAAPAMTAGPTLPSQS